MKEFERDGSSIVPMMGLLLVMVKKTQKKEKILVSYIYSFSHNKGWEAHLPEGHLHLRLCCYQFTT